MWSGCVLTAARRVRLDSRALSLLSRAHEGHLLRLPASFLNPNPNPDPSGARHISYLSFLLAERVLRRKLERHLARAGLVVREGRAEDVPALEELCRAANMYAGLDSLPAHFAALLRQPTFKSLVALDAVSGRMVGHVYGRAVERGAVVLLGGARTHPEWQGADKRVFNSLGFAMGVELGCLARARPTRYLNPPAPGAPRVLEAARVHDVVSVTNHTRMALVRATDTRERRPDKYPATSTFDMLNVATMICPREVFERARPQEGVRELRGEAIREPLVRAAGAGRKFVNYSSSEVALVGGEWAGDEGVQVFASAQQPGAVSLVNWERVGQRATVLNVHFYGGPDTLLVPHVENALAAMRTAAGAPAGDELYVTVQFPAEQSRSLAVQSLTERGLRLPPPGPLQDQHLCFLLRIPAMLSFISSK